MEIVAAIGAGGYIGSLSTNETRETRNARSACVSGPRHDGGPPQPCMAKSPAASRFPDGRWSRRVVANFWQIRQNLARFRLYRRRSLQVNTRCAAFFKIYQII